MEKGYIIETSTQLGFWEVGSNVVYLNKKVAVDLALIIMKDSHNKVMARVKEMDIVKN